MLISLRIVGTLSIENREALLDVLQTKFGAHTHYDGMHSDFKDHKNVIQCTLHDADTDIPAPVWRTIADFVGDDLDRLSVGLATDPHGRFRIAA